MKERDTSRRRIRIHLPLPSSHSNINKPPRVLEAFLGTTLGGLFLLCRLDLGCARLDFTRVGEGAVNNHNDK